MKCCESSKVKYSDPPDSPALALEVLEEGAGVEPGTVHVVTD